jgi:D-amino-acid dehydrogenase
MQHDKYVLSAGSHCLPLCQSINLKLPVRPVKGYSITAPISNRMKRPTVAVRDYDIHTAITPIGNTLRVAGTAEFSGFSNALKEKRLQHLLKLLHLTYPRAIMPFTPTKKLQPWAGLRPMSADGVPIISHSTFHNLYLNTGHGPLGWTAAAASGRLLTDILQKKRSLLPIEAYSIKRF